MKIKLLVIGALLTIGGVNLVSPSEEYSSYVSETISAAEEEADEAIDDNFSFFGYWTGSEVKSKAMEIVNDQLTDQFNRIKETGELY